MSYKIEILNSALTRVATIANTPALDNAGMFLEYSQKLSHWGECRFRVATDDPMLDQLGDILKPFQYHVRIKRNTTVVFQGIIIRNPHRNRQYIEVVAYSYLYLLNLKRIEHDASTTPGDNKDNYLTMSSGTMASQITTMINKAVASSGQLALKSLTIGQINNPNFPAGYTKVDGTPLTGAWTFSSDLTLQYSYVPVLKAISALGIYGKSDFEITNNMVFNFKSSIGTTQSGMVFTYGMFGGTYGNIEDFNLPLDGANMANDLLGVAADTQGQSFHTVKQDTTSIATYGSVEGTAAFSDVKDKNTLITRLTEELLYVSDPIGDMSITLNSTAPPVGQYSVGDLVTVKIKSGIYNVDMPRKIVGIFVKVHTTGKEVVRLSTNQPRNS
jgi:hypothetical protein